MRATYTFITGSSSGIGAATAKLLSEDRNVIIHGRDIQRLEAVAAACAEHGSAVRLFPYDLEQVDSLAKNFGAFLKDQGIQVDSFVHCAGMTEVLPMKSTKYSIGLQVMQVNYFAAAEIISTLLKKKINSDTLSSIVLFSSIVTRGGKKYQPHYCASKGAINALTYALACELAPRVRVNAIAPGSFKTRMVATLFTGEPDDTTWAPPTLLPPGEVEDAANVVKFLLSQESRYLTGQILDVDGGEHFPKL